MLQPTCSRQGLASQTVEDELRLEGFKLSIFVLRGLSESTANTLGCFENVDIAATVKRGLDQEAKRRLHTWSRWIVLANTSLARETICTFAHMTEQIWMLHHHSLHFALLERTHAKVIVLEAQRLTMEHLFVLTFYMLRPLWTICRLLQTSADILFVVSP